ncbi:MAG: integrin alpha [bacterium]
MNAATNLIIKILLLLATLTATGLAFTPCTAHLTLYGEAAGDRFGYSVANAGDINKDGEAEILVGAPYAGEGGKVYLYSGTDGSLIITYAAENAGDLFGWSVAGAGDIDDDTYPDFVVGAPDYDNSTGRIYVFSGQKGDLLFAKSGHAIGDKFGYSVSGAGRVNGDENDDLIIGAIRDDLVGFNRGVAYVISGADSTVLYSLTSTGDIEFGFSVAGVGDVDKDGFADVAVGQPSYASGYGMLSVFSSQTGAVLAEYLGDWVGDGMGWCVAAVGDANQDGFLDVVSGAPYYDG